MKPQSKMKIKTQSGFSLVQVMIVMAIMSVMALALGQLISSITGTQSHLQKAFEKQKTFDALRATLSSADNCAKSLGVVGLTLADLPSIVSIGTITGDTISMKVPSPDGLIATQILFINATAAGTERRASPAFVATDYVRTAGSLSITMQKSVPGSNSFDTFKAENFPVIFLTDPISKKIDYCYSGGNTNDQTCEDMFGGTYDSAKGIKCGVHRMSLTQSNIETISNAPGSARLLVEDSMVLFSGTGGAASSLIFQDGTSAPAAATLNASKSQINFSSGGGLSIVAPLSTSNLTFSAAATNRATFNNFVSVGVSRAGPSAVAAMSIDAGAAAGLGLAVTGTSTFNGISAFTGNMTVTGPGPNVITVNGGNVFASSDRRLKMDIHVITEALDKISQIQGVSYVRKTSPDYLEIGVIAQDVQKAFPEAVSVDKDGFLSVNYSGLIGPLIESVKELKSQKDSEIAELKAELHAMKREIAALKKKKK